MTKRNDDGLVERLRAEKFSGRYAVGGSTIDATGNGTSWGGERIMELVNPDGPEAATALEAADKRIAELEERLVDVWHGDPDIEVPLSEFLGMTADEYAAWANPAALASRKEESGE